LDQARSSNEIASLCPRTCVKTWLCLQQNNKIFSYVDHKRRAHR
jgi:hypothetical protein